MAHYIDKSALVAEIEKRLKEYRTFPDYQTDSNYMELCEILSFLNTLETKEVDLEKDVNEIIKTAEDHAYFAGSENTREKFIDKACKWLRKELVNFEDYSGMGEELISDFRKAMEE